MLDETTMEVTALWSSQEGGTFSGARFLHHTNGLNRFSTLRGNRGVEGEHRRALVAAQPH